MRTAVWTHHRYNLARVMHEKDAVCVIVIRSLHCLLYPATFYVMATAVVLIASHCTKELLVGLITVTTSCN